MMIRAIGVGSRWPCQALVLILKIITTLIQITQTQDAIPT
jgi:hypothetical protein